MCLTKCEKLEGILFEKFQAKINPENLFAIRIVINYLQHKKDSGN